jgi:hypothetical protein
MVARHKAFNSHDWSQKIGLWFFDISRKNISQFADDNTSIDKGVGKMIIQIKYGKQSMICTRYKE